MADSCDSASVVEEFDEKLVAIVEEFDGKVDEEVVTNSRIFEISFRGNLAKMIIKRWAKLL